MTGKHTYLSEGRIILTLGALLFCLCTFAASPTRTLPVVYVTTDGGRAVKDTETQVPCGVYIDSVQAQYPSLGTAQAPLRAIIKGRGNWTWNGFDKKPYKIKFDTKQKVLGMPNNRHWCLLAYADDYLGFLKGPAGFALSRAVGLRWTPRQVPVELVLNGKYMGLYFLTEHVRIASHRVHIREQASGETHSDSISGGWLVEIDNYPSAGNIEFDEHNGQHMMVSLCEPDSLSSRQRVYIEQQLYALNDALYNPSYPLESLLDITEAAKFYLVQEIMEDCESYHGSCFLYKDRDSLGVADLWKFGPVWDFGNAYDRHQETWIYDNPPFAQYWIRQLATSPLFRQALEEQWYIFYHDYKEPVRAELTAWAESVAEAARNDARVWNGTQGYQDNSDMTAKRDKFFRRYDWRIQWLYSQWGEGTKPVTYDLEEVESQKPESESTKLLRDGQLYLMYKGQMYDVRGQRVR